MSMFVKTTVLACNFFHIEELIKWEAEDQMAVLLSSCVGFIFLEKR